MAMITVNKASTDFKISRNTLYKHIKQGKLTRNADGLLDVSDCIRLYSSNSVSSEQENRGNEPTIEQLRQQVNRLENTNQNLTQLLAVKEMMVNQLQQQLDDVRKDKDRLFNQLEQKRIEHKANDTGNKGLLKRLFG